MKILYYSLYEQISFNYDRQANASSMCVSHFKNRKKAQFTLISYVFARKTLEIQLSPSCLGTKRGESCLISLHA